MLFKKKAEILFLHIKMIYIHSFKKQLNLSFKKLKGLLSNFKDSHNSTGITNNSGLNLKFR